MRKLNTDANSRIVIYVTSHGGGGFIKIRAKSVILSDDLNRTLIEMYSKKKYKEIVFILDACEAITLYDSVNEDLAPNIFFIGSSIRDEKAQSINYDKDFMTPLADRFSLLLFNSLNKILHKGNLNLEIEQLFDKIRNDPLMKSQVAIKNNVRRKILFKDYFGNKTFYKNLFFKEKSKNLKMIFDKSNLVNKLDYLNKKNYEIDKELQLISNLNISLMSNYKKFHDSSVKKNTFHEIKFEYVNEIEFRKYQNTIQFLFNGFFFSILCYMLYYAFFS